MQTLHTAQQQAGGRLHGNHRSNRSVRVAALQAAHTHQQRQTSSLPFAGKAALTAAAAATALQLLLPAAPAYAALAAPSSSGTGATPAAAWQPVFGDLSLTAAAPSLPAEQEEFASDLLTEEVALPPELMQFMDLIQQVTVAQSPACLVLLVCWPTRTGLGIACSSWEQCYITNVLRVVLRPF